MKIKNQDSISNLLKKTRKSQGYRISEVVEDLNINEEFIRALEDGQIGKLPSQSYTLGFVKAYAKYLGLDPFEAAENFKRTYALQTESFLGVPSEEEKKDLPLNEKINSSLSSFYNSRGTIIFAVIILSFFLGYRILISKPRSAAPIFYNTEESLPLPAEPQKPSRPEKSVPEKREASAERALLSSLGGSVDNLPETK